MSASLRHGTTRAADTDGAAANHQPSRRPRTRRTTRFESAHDAPSPARDHHAASHGSHLDASPDIDASSGSMARATTAPTSQQQPLGLATDISTPLGDMSDPVATNPTDAPPGIDDASPGTDASPGMNASLRVAAATTPTAWQPMSDVAATAPAPLRAPPGLAAAGSADAPPSIGDAPPGFDAPPGTSVPLKR